MSKQARGKNTGALWFAPLRALEGRCAQPRRRAAPQRALLLDVEGAKLPRRDRLEAWSQSAAVVGVFSKARRPAQDMLSCGRRTPRKRRFALQRRCYLSRTTQDCIRSAAAENSSRALVVARMAARAPSARRQQPNLMASATPDEDDPCWALYTRAYQNAALAAHAVCNDTVDCAEECKDLSRESLDELCQRLDDPLRSFSE